MDKGVEHISRYELRARWAVFLSNYMSMYHTETLCPGKTSFSP